MEELDLTKEQRSDRLKGPFLFGGAAVVVLLVHLATNGNLGFHTDEFYYIDCGRHPALGYVDFPPIVPRRCCHSSRGCWFCRVSFLAPNERSECPHKNYSNQSVEQTNG